MVRTLVIIIIGRPTAATAVAAMCYCAVLVSECVSYMAVEVPGTNQTVVSTTTAAVERIGGGREKGGAKMWWWWWYMMRLRVVRRARTRTRGPATTHHPWGLMMVIQRWRRNAG